MRLGDLLVKAQLIDAAQLEKSLSHQKDSGLKLGQALIALGYVTHEQLLSTLSEQLKLPIFDLNQYVASPEIAKKLPEARARRYRALILEETNADFLVGMADPIDINAIDQLQASLGKPIRIAIVREDDLLHSLDQIYRRTDDISSFAEALDEEVGDDYITIQSLDAELKGEDAPVIKLLQSVFADAVQIGASDIHIEPGEKNLRIRQRVDGVLQEQIMKQRHICNAIMVRLKLMSNLNIAEKRLPQDGRFHINIRNKVIDIRLSIMPTQYGESAVMRLLDQSNAALSLENIGMQPDMLKQLRAVMKLPHGIILVTGPTGSGKTTTLYGGLKELNTSDKKIITAEDPIEYRLERINQVQINHKVGLDFAKVLRVALRQDPDIVMLGEMRDNETSSIAIRAALTGHLVLSTLHTNDAASSAFRLVDMGIEGFMVGSTLRAILAQRLVRKICARCVKPYQPSADEQIWLEAIAPQFAKAPFKQGSGCAYCNKTGFKGRQGIFELLIIDKAMIHALRENDSGKFSDLADKKLKGAHLLENALTMAKLGQTTLSEVQRVAGEVVT